jgi:hypothetical protein
MSEVKISNIDGCFRSYMRDGKNFSQKNIYKQKKSTKTRINKSNSIETLEDRREKNKSVMHAIYIYIYNES